MGRELHSFFIFRLLGPELSSWSTSRGAGCGPIGQSYSARSFLGEVCNQPALRIFPSAGVVD